MSKAHFSDDCPDCRPCAIDLQTGKRMPDDSAVMQSINAAWAKMTLEDRQAFHRFTCLNSRAPADLAAVAKFKQRIEDEQ